MQDTALVLATPEALTPEVLSQTSSPELSPDAWLFGQVAPSTTEAVLALHSHNDGFIALAKGDEDSLRPTVAIRADYFRDMFPEIQHEYLKDGYVSINAAGRTWPSKQPSSGYPKHRINTLKYLNAVFADVDHYQPGLSFWEALARVGQMEDLKAIPKFSMVIRSGQGLWLVWLLHDNSGGPQGAREGLPLWNQINAALIEKLLLIGADRATHAARYCRLHGSLNTKNEETVEWFTRGSDHGSIPTYTLEQLAASLQIDPTLRDKIFKTFTEQDRKKLEPARKNPNRRRGRIALHAQRLEKLIELWGLRGKFQKGTRKYAVYLAAVFLRGAGFNHRHIKDMAYKLGLNGCSPRLPGSDVTAQLAAALETKTIRITNQTIANWLKITTEEAQLLGKWPAASGNAQPIRQTPPSKKDEIAERRRIIQEIVAELVTAPVVREMVTLLAAKGIETSIFTVSIDYRFLGIETTRKRQQLLAAGVRGLQTVLPNAEVSRENFGGGTLIAPSNPQHQPPQTPITLYAIKT